MEATRRRMRPKVLHERREITCDIEVTQDPHFLLGQGLRSASKREYRVPYYTSTSTGIEGLPQVQKCFRSAKLRGCLSTLDQKRHCRGVSIERQRRESQPNTVRYLS